MSDERDTLEHAEEETHEDLELDPKDAAKIAGGDATLEVGERDHRCGFHSIINPNFRS